MPRRALLNRRPWLLVSLLAALAYYGLKDADFPGLYLLMIEAAALILLGVYALLRHHSAEARMVAGAMVLSGLGVVMVELTPYFGALTLVGGIALLIGLFLRTRREQLASSQKAAATALLLLTPLIAWLMTRGLPEQALVATFGLAMGGMAAAAWGSAFPRYRVGAGAVCYVLSSLLTIAALVDLADPRFAAVLAWPLFYLAHFLMCTGIIQTLRLRDLESDVGPHRAG